MTALAADRKADVVASASARYRSGKVGAGVKIYKNAAIAKNAAGFLVPAAATLGLRFVGVAQEQADNTAGADGAISVKYITAVSIKFKNDGTSPIAQANLYTGVVYIKDDQTVQASSSKGVVAGV